MKLLLQECGGDCLTSFPYKGATATSRIGLFYLLLSHALSSVFLLIFVTCYFMINMGLPDRQQLCGQCFSEQVSAEPFYVFRETSWNEYIKYLKRRLNSK
jgi:hypothetical protein